MALLGVLLARAASGQVVLAPGDGRRDLGGAVEVLEDASGKLTVDQAMAASGWRRGTWPTFSDSAFWVRARLGLPAAESGWVLHLGTTQIDHVDAYLRAPGGAWRVVRTGDRRDAAVRDVRHPAFAFRLPAGEVEAVLRLRSTGTLAASLAVVRGDVFARRAAEADLAWGLYFAFLAALALYNLFLFASIRDRSYLYYVGYLTAFVLFQAAQSGHAALYLWPSLPLWASLAPATLLALSLASALLFVRRMADFRVTLPRLHRPMGWLAATFAAAVPLLLIDFTTTVRVMAGLGGLTMLLLPVPLAIAYRRGYRPARYLLLASAAIIPGGVLLALRYLQVLPAHFLVDHSLQLGSAVEALLLSFALADRINLLHRERAAAQRALLEAQESERQRIARDLHDGLGQSLLVIVSRLKRAAQSDAELDPLAEDAKALVRDVRRIAHDLDPDQLRRLGLSAAVRSAAEQTLAPAGIALSCEVAGVDGLLTRQRELQVYRVAQEALSNIVRHSRARSAAVKLEPKDGGLVLTVEDDGEGITGAGGGIGMASLRQRASLVGGTLEVGAAAKQGLRVRLSVPREADAR